MSIPIQKVRFGDEISPPDMEPKLAAGAGGTGLGVRGPIRERASYGTLSPSERQCSFENLSKHQQTRLNRMFYQMHGDPGAGTSKLFVNLHSQGDHISTIKTYLDMLYSKHPYMEDKRKRVVPNYQQVTNMMMDTECLYGMKVNSMEELDMALCGKISLVLVRLIKLIIKRNDNDPSAQETCSRCP